MTMSRGAGGSPRMVTLARVVLIGQPILLAAVLILARWSDEATPVETLVRPMLAGVTLAAVSLASLRLMTGSWAWAALIASGLVLFTMREILPALVIGIAALAWLVLILFSRATRRATPSGRIPLAVARGTGIFTAALFLLMGALAVRAADLGGPELHFPQYTTPGTGGPNIYVLLLDGYPRADSLKETFGIDNEPFLDQIAALEFIVSEDARTNYNKTWLTLASALNGVYIEDLVGDQPLPTEARIELRWLHKLINEASILGFLRDRGYAIRTIPPPYTSAALTMADEYLEMGRLTEFEVKLIGASPWALIFRDEVAGFLFDAQREQAIDGLEATARLAESPSAAPQFVLSHIHSPHPPFVLTPSPRAEHAPVASCFPLTCTFWEARIERLMIGFGEYRTGLRNQIEGLNEIVMDTVRRITAADPGGVVILMSDHGTRYSLEDLPEHYRSFLATRTPGFPGLFPHDESPVNILRRVMSAYFDADIEPLPYRAWALDWTYNLRLTELPAE